MKERALARIGIALCALALAALAAIGGLNLAEWLEEKRNVDVEGLLHTWMPEAH
jgi:hypothetical protein